MTIKYLGLFITILTLTTSCSTKYSDPKEDLDSIFESRISDTGKIENQIIQEDFDSIFELRNSGTREIENQNIQDFRNKRILAIGESSHGTKEFNDLRIDVVESFLKENIPINILLEVTIHQGQLIDNFITDDTTDFDIIQKQFYPLLRNSSFKSLLELCKQANYKRLPKDKIRIYGIDPSYDKSLTDHLNESIRNSEINPPIPDELRNYFRNLKFEQLIDVDPSLRDSIRYRLFKLKKITSSGANIKNSLAIEQFLQALKRLDEPIYSRKSLTTRDSSMARNVGQIATMDSLRYNILFAHNEHISMSTSYTHRFVPMGSFLSKNFKEGYYPIAVDFIEGTYRINSNVTAPLYSRNSDEWIKSILLKMIDAAYMKTDCKYFDRNVKLHAMGSGSYSPSFETHNLRNDFRAIILFRYGNPTDKRD